jgi:hypothetical protein
MTSAGDGQQSYFKVSVSGQIKQTIKTLHQKAAARGHGKQFLAAFRAIYQHLRTDPREFGDPLFQLPALKLTVFQAVVAPAVVHYAVHQAMPLVIVRNVRLFGLGS